MKRRIEIIVEAERTVLVAGTILRRDRWCAACAATVPFLWAPEASLACDVPVRSIFRWVEEGRVHFIEERRDLVVCVPSLQRLRAARTAAQ